MTAGKIMLVAACAAGLSATPAWAKPDRAANHPGRGTPHACVAHAVAYVASGSVVRQALTLDGSAAGGRRLTVSGDVTVDVTRANRPARADKGTTKTYTLDHARLLLALADQNGDGKVDLGDVLPGSRVKVIGKVTKLAPRCDQTGFVPQLTIRKLIVHAPKPAGG